MVVVGGGGSGMAATIEGRMRGLKVVLVEKMPYIGGAAAISGGQVVAQGSKLQKQFGSTKDSPESMMKDFLANGHNLNDKRMLSLYAHNVGQTIDWLHDKVGVKFIPNDLPYLAEYSHRRALEFQGGAKTMAQHLKKVISENGANVLYNTRVQKLLTDDKGNVTGVRAVDNNGVTYTITSKATLLTTGGFGNNKEMLSEPVKSALYYGPVSSTGDGHQMAFPTLAADSGFFHLEARIHRAFQNLKIYVGVATTFVSGKCSFLLKAEGASTRLRASKLNNADIRSNKPAS